MRPVRSISFVSFVAALWLVVVGPAPAAGQDPAPAGQSHSHAEQGGGYAQDAQPLLQRYCHQCHGPEKQKAQVRYDRITGYRVEDRHLWAEVHEQLSAGG